MTWGPQIMAATQTNFMESQMDYQNNFDTFINFKVAENEGQLISELKKLFVSDNQTRLLTNWSAGSRINQYERTYGEATMAKLAEDTGKSQSSLYKYCVFARSFSPEQLQILLDASFISWRIIADNLDMEAATIIELLQASQDRKEFLQKIDDLKGEGSAEEVESGNFSRVTESDKEDSNSGPEQNDEQAKKVSGSKKGKGNSEHSISSANVDNLLATVIKSLRLVIDDEKMVANVDLDLIKQLEDIIKIIKKKKPTKKAK